MTVLVAGKKLTFSLPFYVYSVQTEVADAVSRPRQLAAQTRAQYLGAEAAAEVLRRVWPRHIGEVRVGVEGRLGRERFVTRPARPAGPCEGRSG